MNDLADSVLSTSDAAPPTADHAGRDMSNQDTSSDRVWVWLERCVIGLPILSLAIALLAWLTYGVDLPSLDDWRDYEAGTAGSFDLDYLFRSSNDTAYPVGKALDSLAARVLGGNAVAYQFLSMLFVLGSLLALQYRLLGLVSTSRGLKAAAFGLTVLMLQPGSYWGHANLAYHQAIPLVVVLAMLALLVADSIGSRFLIAGLAFLATVSGFIYISGAISNLVVLVAATFGALYYDGSLRKRFRQAAGALLIPTVVSLVLQLRVLLVVQQGTHRDDAPLAYPFESDFWLYSFGKIGRSLFLPSRLSGLSLLLSVVAVAALVLTLWRSAKAIPGRHHRTIAQVRTPLILTILTGTVLAYLMLVAAGRTNLRPDGLDFLEIFQFGFLRFHYFWLTLLWPWVFLVLCERIVADTSRGSAIATKAAVAASLGLILILMATGVMGHFSRFRDDMNHRLGELACAQDLSPGTPNAACAGGRERITDEAVEYASSLGATFLRSLPDQAAYLAAQSTAVNTVTEFDADRLAEVAVITNGVAELTAVNGVRHLEITPDAETQLVVPVPDATPLDTCQRMHVEITVFDPLANQATADIAQLFYDPIDDALGFDADKHVSLARRTNPGSASELRFTAESVSGFENQLRVDLTQGTAAMAIERVVILCDVDRAAAFVSPPKGAVLTCDSQPVAFLGGTAGDWHVRAGSEPLAWDYFSGVSSSGTSILVTGLPNDGSPVFLTLFFEPPGGALVLVDEATYAACSG